MVTWAQLMMPSPSISQTAMRAQQLNEAGQRMESTHSMSASTAMQETVSSTIATLADSFVQLDSVLKNV